MKKQTHTHMPHDKQQPPKPTNKKSLTKTTKKSPKTLTNQPTTQEKETQHKQTNQTKHQRNNKSKHFELLKHRLCMLRARGFQKNDTCADLFLLHNITEWLGLYGTSGDHLVQNE